MVKGKSILSVSGSSEEYTELTAKAYIKVTFPTGSSCKCAKDSVEMYADDLSGTYIFGVPSLGNWTVSIDNESSTEQIVSVTENYQMLEVTVSRNHIYGIQRGQTAESPEWERTDDAVGFTYTASEYSTDVIGSSSFDNCYPWSHMTRETLSDGDVMVKIPKFWFKVTSTTVNSTDYWLIQVADYAADGFSLHPAFTRNSSTQDYIYVGAYESSGTSSTKLSSLSGQPVYTSTDFSATFNLALNKGKNWGLWDFYTYSAIEMLFLVETANNNSQLTTGYGVTSTSTSYLNTGNTDVLTYKSGSRNLTNDGKSMVWRGIENLWGNAPTILQGIYYYYGSSSSSRYIKVTQKFNYNTTSDFTSIGNYNISGQPKGFNSFIAGGLIIPNTTANSSAEYDKYLCDFTKITGSTSCYIVVGGGYPFSSTTIYNGIFYFSIASSETFATRLAYIPQL